MENQSHYNPTQKGALGRHSIPTEVSPFFEVERQIGKMVEMISFGLRTGTKRAFPIMIFDEITWHPETGISLFGRNVTVKIAGRNLDRLYQMLVLRRVREVREYYDENVEEEDLYIQSINLFSDYDGN